MRFVGAGTIGVAAIYTLGKLVKPVFTGLTSAMQANRVRKAGNLASLPRTEHDIPIPVVGMIMAACFVPIGFLLSHFADRDRPGRACAGADRRRPDLHRGDELPGLDGVRLHGRPDRLVQQSAVGHRHPRGDRRGAAARVRHQAVPRAGAREGPGRVRAVRHRGGVHRRGDRQQQPAGPQDRPARRRHAVGAAVGADRRRDRGRGGHSAGAVDRQPGLRIHRCAGRRSRARARRAAGGPDLRARAGRDPEEHRLEPDPHRRRHRRRADRHRRGPAPHDEDRAPRAARRRPGHLPADVGDVDGGGGRDRRCVLRPPRRSRPASGSDQATRRAAGLRHDRRRRPGRRADRRASSRSPARTIRWGWSATTSPASTASWIGGIAFVAAIFALYRWIERLGRQANA